MGRHAELCQSLQHIQGLQHCLRTSGSALGWLGAPIAAGHSSGTLGNDLSIKAVCPVYPPNPPKPPKVLRPAEHATVWLLAKPVLRHAGIADGCALRAPGPHGDPLKSLIAHEGGPADTAFLAVPPQLLLPNLVADNLSRQRLAAQTLSGVMLGLQQVLSGLEAQQASQSQAQAQQSDALLLTAGRALSALKQAGIPPCA